MVRLTGASAVDLQERFAAFVTERYPFAAALALDAFAAARQYATAVQITASAHVPTADIQSTLLQHRLEFELRERLKGGSPTLPVETTPGVTAPARFRHAVEELVSACHFFLTRESLRASLTDDERREILRGMILTRATDNRLKRCSPSGEVRYGDAPFQGKGFRSLGQEAIYAAGDPPASRRRATAMRLALAWRRDRAADPRSRGRARDAPGRPRPSAWCCRRRWRKPVRRWTARISTSAISTWGILPAAAPLAIGSLTIAGMAMAFGRDGSGRVALSFIGEGGSSLGEWHEAINLCAARRLPAVFCVQNNQTALSTPVAEQSAVRVFADKAVGYGIPGITIDGTDPDEIAAAFAWAVERARAGEGPALIELVCMRMCGHAHHDDMLYLGKDPAPGWSYPRRRVPGLRRSASNTPSGRRAIRSNATRPG